MDDWLAKNLVCPRDLGELQRSGDELVCAAGHKYPLVDDIPVMLLEDVEATHEPHSQQTFESVSAARENGNSGPPSEQSHDQQNSEHETIHPYVQQAIVGTCGILYRPVLGKLTRYPIPELRLPQASGERLLDIGCNWGRWCIAAARKGYHPVGIDPSLDAVRAARDVCRQLHLTATFVVADARYLPFATDCFDVVFSYSVLQHFSKQNAKLSLEGVARVVKPQGRTMIQMPNKFGIRCLYHQARRGFREGKDFEVRYWTLRELKKTFAELIGPTSLSVDGFFGLGIQKSDVDILPPKYKLVVRCSEILRRMDDKVKVLKTFADSIYLDSVREEQGA